MALRLAFGMALWFIATAGGRITASDEYTMYRLTESLVTRGTVAVASGNAERGPDGRLYPKAAIGQAIAAAPFYAAGRLVSLAFPEKHRELVTRAVTSLLGPVCGGLLAAFLFLLFLEVGASPRGALFWSVATCLTTPLWVYAKSFLTEPLSALGLVAGLYGALRFARGGGPQHALLCGLAWGGTVLVKYALLPAVVVLAIPFVPTLRRGRDALPGVFAVLVCAALALAYNAMRTGSVLGSGYGRQGTLDAFSTPLFVGLHGLLLSSGKGVIWFAPLVMLVPAAIVPAWRRLGAPALAIALACTLMTLVYASFEHWAGDGSWGPRYLVPLIPLALVLAVAAHAQQPWGGAPRRTLVGVLAAFGLLVQLGGVGVYFGAQMREAGDYPYTRALDDPSFMVESHFNPARSPIAHHWRMLARNAREHAEGRWPRLAPASRPSGVESERLAVPADQVEGLTHALDFWWAYAAYAGLPRLPLLVLAAAVAAAAVLQLVYAARSARDLELRPLPQAPDVWAA